MSTVVVTGAQSQLGQRVSQLIEEPTELRPVSGPLDAADLTTVFDHADTVLHLATGTPPSPVGGTTDVQAGRAVLEAADKANVRNLVLISDATVYGAWPNNPVPLTDDAVLRPNPGFTFAAERAELERLASEWRADHPASRVAILRPVRTPGWLDWLVDALRPGPAVPDDADEPSVQFLDLDDLASAVEVALSRQLDGAFNVAPDGSIPADEVRSLTAPGPRLRLPSRVIRRIAGWRFRSGLGSTPPELVPYTLNSWVVANDRLRAQGWAPAVTNQEAAVASHQPGPLENLSPKRRQELALGIAGVGLAGLAAGGALLARRVLKKPNG